MSSAAALRFGLLLVRPGLLVMTTPFLGGSYAPTTTRLGLTVLIALILSPIVPAPVDATMGALTYIVGREVLIGLSLSMGVRVLIFGTEAAGQMLGYQLGLSYGSIVDPQSGVRNSVLAALYSNLAIVLAFAGGLHHALLRAITASYSALPIGLGAGVSNSLVQATADMFGVVLILAVRVAAPVIVVLLATEALLGLMARIAPAFNIMVVGAPARLVVGLLVIAATLISLPPLVARYAPVTLNLAAETARAFR